MICFNFFVNKRSLIFHAHSPETVCMKCQRLLSGKTKKNISKCCLLKIFPSMLSIKLLLNFDYMMLFLTSCNGIANSVERIK